MPRLSGILGGNPYEDELERVLDAPTRSVPGQPVIAMAPAGEDVCVGCGGFAASLVDGRAICHGCYGKGVR